MKKIKAYLTIIAVVMLCNTCGKSYLDKRPIGELDEKDLSNKRGVEGLLIGAYSMLDGINGDIDGDWFSAASNWIYGTISGSEAYTGSEPIDETTLNMLTIEKFKSHALLTPFEVKWRIVYEGVQRANEVLRIMQKAKDISTQDQKHIAAEARFLRAHYHFEAKKIWNKVPYVDETITYGNRNYHLSNDKDIWPDIERDLQYAMDNLSEIPYGNAIGRSTKYTAMALLAKAYMFQKKFTQAKPLLEVIINSGKYKLLEYSSNFDPASRNSSESIFSVQMSVNDRSAGYNGNFGDAMNFPFIPNQLNCCGYFQPSQYLVNHFKTDSVTGLPDLDQFNVVDVFNDEGYESSDPTFTPYGGSLDPRLDWTIGRRGIPYLDWGNHPGNDWIRKQGFGGPYSPKKNAYNKAQQGLLTDQSFWGGFPMTTTNNVNLIRYADILLWAAEVEAEVEVGSLDKAQQYLNMIRNRMADHHEYWVHKYLDDNNPQGGFYTDDAHLAANYFIKPYPAGDFAAKGKDFALKAIRFERMLELGMEGHRFFDLVRWGIAGTEIDAYLGKEKIKRTYLDDASFTRNKNEYFPIPQSEIYLSAGADGIAKMKQNPGY